MNFTRMTHSPLAQMLSATAIFALVLSLVYGGFPVAQAVQDEEQDIPKKEYPNNPNIEICHATESDENPYNSITVDASSIINNPNGHAYHDDGGIEDMGDIIPAFSYDLGEGEKEYEGKNWDAEGQAIWKLDCEIPEKEVPGCTDPLALNYNKDAAVDDDSCEYDEVKGAVKVWKYIVGTTTVSAENFSFTVDGGESISFPATGNEWNQYPFAVVEVSATGTHTVTENAAPGYYTTYALTSDLEDTATPDTLDACKNITLTEEHPYAYCRITNTVDVCPNIDLAQTSIPTGMKKNDAGNCVPDIPQCVAQPNGGWATGYTSVSQGTLKNGSAITNPDRTNPAAVVGVEDWTNGGNTGFFSIGFGGSIVVTFTNFVPNLAGDDLTVYEATNGNDYPPESVKVEVSQDGVTWETLTESATNADTATRATGLDFDETSFSWIKYVRLTDTTDPTPHTADADGFDLDAVRATQTVCTNPEPEYCSIELVSGTDFNTNLEDDNTTVTEKSGALAKLLSFVHPAWTAAISGAAWIWGDNPVQAPVIGASQTFVRTFGWNGVVTDAKLYVAADNTYSTTLNGDAAGAETVDANNFATADVYDVDGLIDQGNNVLSINVVNTVGSEDPRGNPAGLLYKLVVTTEDNVDCDIPYEEEDDTTITVTKIVEEGSDEETAFEFELNDESFATLAHGESETEAVKPGSYKIEELGEEDWNLENASCVNEDKETVGSWDGALYIELEEGDDVTCTFVNEEEEDDSDPRVCRIGENLISNGSFEQPAIQVSWTIETSVPSWAYTTDGIEIWRNFDGTGAGVASLGLQNAELDGNSATDISQTIATVPGTVYELSFDFSARAGVPENSLDARADGNLIVSASANGSSNSGNEWEEYVGTFVATDASTVITFEDTAPSDSLGTLLDNVVLCVTDEVPLYTIDGYKWNDQDGDGFWDENEPTLSNWTIRATNGDVVYSTTTDATGHYEFNVPAGNWEVTEVQQVGWDQTYPDPQGESEGACYAYFYEYELDSRPFVSDDSADSTSDWEYSGECNFGNRADQHEDPKLACSIEASASEVDEGGDVTIFWSSTLADGATLNGNAVALAGSQLFEDLEEDTTYTLVVTDNVDSDEDPSTAECSVTVEVDEDGGGSSSTGSRKKRSTSDEDPIGEVLGETTSVLPVGAPDTGAGGTSTNALYTLIALFGMLLSLLTLRATKNVR